MGSNANPLDLIERDLIADKAKADLAAATAVNSELRTRLEQVEVDCDIARISSNR
jgi:hypothetical protein